MKQFRTCYLAMVILHGKLGQLCDIQIYFCTIVNIQAAAVIKTQFVDLGYTDNLPPLGVDQHCNVSSCGFVPFPEVVKTKGLEHITVDDLVQEITPKGRGLQYKKTMIN